jgi:L-lactate dehydrogenase (cytochrome)
MIREAKGRTSVPSMELMTCIEDLRVAARRKVPRAFFDYVEAGSYSEETKRFNRTDMEKVKLRQRVLVDMTHRDTSTTIIGEKFALPLALAPVAVTGL